MLRVTVPDFRFERNRCWGTWVSGLDTLVRSLFELFSKLSIRSAMIYSLTPWGHGIILKKVLWPINIPIRNCFLHWVEEFGIWTAFGSEFVLLMSSPSFSKVLPEEKSSKGIRENRIAQPTIPILFLITHIDLSQLLISIYARGGAERRGMVWQFFW